MENQIIQGDSVLILKTLSDQIVNCCVTSPPYWGLRDYGVLPSKWPTITYSPMPGLSEIFVSEWIGCLGLEPTIEMFVAHIVLIFREVKRVLRDDGTLWLNFGDSYAGSGKGYGGKDHGKLGKHANDFLPVPNVVPSGLRPKDLVGIPWRCAFALQADGWYLRMDNIWNKPNCMPESVADRPTKSHEYMFLLSKSKKYYYNAEAIKEPAAGFNFIAPAGSKGAFGPEQSRRRAKGNAKTFRGGGQYTQGQSFNNSTEVDRESHGNQPNESGLRNKRSVWTVATAQLPESHFATFPEKLIEPCILSGCPENGRVLDPFFGSGTVGRVAIKYGRCFTGIELNREYIEIAKNRTNEIQAVFNY